jgi:uncharacterized protein (TIGR00730 family)
LTTGKTVTEIKSIGIFCGSSAGADNAYMAAAEELGRLVASRGMTVVYGGASVGLMGCVADAALQAGGRVIGVIPDSLNKPEIAHTDLTELEVVNSMFQRKERMIALSDGFISIPGGIGTLDELFEVWSLRALQAHMKPVGLLNLEGYFDPLLEFIDRMVDQGFLRSSWRALLHVAPTSDELLSRMGL